MEVLGRPPSSRYIALLRVFVDLVLIMTTIQRHLTGEFEKKYIGEYLSHIFVFWVALGRL